jgi:hypothetical protein
MSNTRAIIGSALDRVAGGACSSCGFFDPQALEDDPNLVDKICDALKRGEKFACHAGMPHDEFGRFVPSLEQQRAAPLCAGFAAVRQELARRGLLEKPPRNLVIAICLEVLARGRAFSCVPSKI